MTTIDKKRRWQVDQLDPDNWLRIPEFDVTPEEVAFVGFEFPFVHPAAKNYELMEQRRDVVKRARKLARRSFSKLAELRDAYIDVMDALELGGAATTAKEVDATRYMLVILKAEILSRNEDSMVLTEGIKELEAELAEWAEPMGEWFERREAAAGAAAADAINKLRRP